MGGACQRRRQTGTVSRKFIPTVLCVSPAGGAEKDGEQDLFFATHSSLHISRERCWTGTRRGTVSVKSLLIVPCVSPVGAEEYGEHSQKHLSSLSSLRISRKRCRTRPVTEVVSGKSVLIFPCVSSAGDAEQNDEQEQSQTKSPRRFLQLFRGRGRVRWQTGKISNTSLSRGCQRKPEEEQLRANLFPFFPATLPQTMPEKTARKKTVSRTSFLIAPCASLVGGVEETTSRIASCVSLVGGAEETDKHDSSLRLSRGQCRGGRQTGALSNKSLLESLLWAGPRRTTNRSTLKQISPCTISVLFPGAMPNRSLTKSSCTWFPS